MSLHDPNFATDKHLQTALRNAPDHDLAPSERVRESILNYANHAVKPASENWLKRALSAFANWRVNSWQVAGMGALASVFLIIVMVRDQVPQETIWAESTVGDLAQNKVESPKALESIQMKQDAGQRETSRSAAASAQQNTPMRMESTAPEAKSALTKEVAPAEVVLAEEAPAKPLAETTEMAASPSAMADKAEVTVVAEAPEAAAPVSAPASSAEKDAQLGSSKTAAAARSMVIKHDSIAEQLIKQGGEVLAKQDIAAGNLRILKVETVTCENLGKHDLHDAVTHYQLVLLNACDLDVNKLQSEVGVYNQTMLNWRQNSKE